MNRCRKIKRVIGGATIFVLSPYRPASVPRSFSFSMPQKFDDKRNGACKSMQIGPILIDIYATLFSPFFLVYFGFFLLLRFLLFIFFIFLILIIRFIKETNKYYTCYIGCSHSSQFDFVCFLFSSIFLLLLFTSIS